MSVLAFTNRYGATRLPPEIVFHVSLVRLKAMAFYRMCLGQNSVAPVALCVCVCVSVTVFVRAQARVCLYVYVCTRAEMANYYVLA